MGNKLSKITWGRFSLPLLAGCVNLLMFGVPMTFLREMMVSQFGWDDLMKGVPKQGDFMIMVVLGNTGKMMLANSLTMLAIFSAASDDDTVYRLIRAATITRCASLPSSSASRSRTTRSTLSLARRLRSR